MPFYTGEESLSPSSSTKKRRKNAALRGFLDQPLREQREAKTDEVDRQSFMLTQPTQEPSRGFTGLESRSAGDVPAEMRPPAIQPRVLVSKEPIRPQQTAQDFIDQGKKTRQENTFFPKSVRKVLDRFGEAVDRLQVGTSVGRAASRFANKVGDIQGVDVQAAKGAPVLSTGSGFVDKVSDIAGTAAGFLADPVPIQGAIATHGTGAVLKAAGQKMKRGFSSMIGEGKAVAQQALPSNNLGFSALVKKAGPYDNLKTDTKSQLTSRLAKEPRNLNGAAHKVYTQVVDDLHQLNRFDKLTEKVLDKKLAPTESPYKLALGSRGADVVAKQILTDAQVDSTGKVIGKSLKESLSSIPPDKFVDFEDYLVNKHAITRFERGEKVFRDELKWTPDVGKAKISQYEAQFPEFKQAAEGVRAFQNNMLDKWLVDTGVLSKEQAAAYKAANPDYVPMKRFFTDLEKVDGAAFKQKKGFANQSKPTKEYSPTGSQRKIISPIESMIENVDAFVKTAKRNQSMQSLVKNIQQAPDAFKGFAEIVQQPGKLDNIKGIDLTSPDALDEVLARMSDDFDRVMRKTKLDKDNVVRVLMNGQPVHVKINDKQLLDALTSLGPDNGSKILDALGWLTGKMKVLTTGANPVFSLTRNILRDIPQAYISSKTTDNPIRFVADLADAGWSILRNKELYKEFKNVGGGHSSSVAADRNLLRQSKREIWPRKSKLQGIVPRAFNKLENAMNAVESAPRLAEYKRLAASGEFDDRLLGLFEANDVTVNFKRRGKLTRELDKVFPYFNAAVQGLDKFGRLLLDDPVKAPAKAFLAVTIPTLVAYAYNYDNPDYKKLSNNLKDNFIMIPKGDGTFIKIAKPKEIGTAFSDIPERLLRMFYEKDPEAFKDFATQLRNTFTLPGVQGGLKQGGITDRLSGIVGDTILGPIADIQANQDFAGRPIVPGYLDQLSPELQADARTSSPSRKIGELTHTSPKKLDYLIRQYTGVLGQVGLPMMAPGSGSPLEAFGNSMRQQVTADPAFSNDIMTKFYDLKGKYDQANTDESVTGKLPAWYNDETRKELGRVNKSLSDIRASMRTLESDTSVPAAEKRDQLRRMQEQMNQIADFATYKVNGARK